MDIRKAYEDWLLRVALDDGERDALRALSDAEIEDRFYAPLSFGTAGMRGVLGAGLNRMNIQNVRRASAAVAKLLLQTEGGASRGCAVAYDSRRMSREFARETALVLCNMGVKAYLFDDLRPVPMLSFTLRDLGCMAGVVITASHNPKIYNGYKVYWADGGQLPPERAERVQALIAETDFADALPMDEGKARASGLLVSLGREADDRYMAYVKTLLLNPALDKAAGGTLKIVYSPLHGAGNIPVRRALCEAGFTDVSVVPEQEMPDPDFSTVRVPNPEEADAFALALALTGKIGADVTFATDPDCDRVGLAVRDGAGQTRILTGNEIGCLLLHYILACRKELGTLPKNAACVKSVVTTELARAICDDYGVCLIDVLTGFKFIAEQIERFEQTGEHSFVFGFEESCGYLSGTRVRDKDGVNACLLIAEAALYYKQKGMTLFDAYRAMCEKYGYYQAKVVSVSLPGLDGLARMAAIMKRLRDQPPQSFADFGVVEARDFAGGWGGMPPSNVLYYKLTGGAWVCVRPSGTEPKIKLYVNVRANNEQDAVAAAARLADAAKEALS